MSDPNHGALSRSRREFAKSCALAVAAPFLAGTATAEESPKPKPVLPATIEAMMEIVRARYGKHLTEEQLKEVQRGIGQNVAVAERMKKFKLANGDEPAFVFRAEVS